MIKIKRVWKDLHRQGNPFAKRERPQKSMAQEVLNKSQVSFVSRTRTEAILSKFQFLSRKPRATRN